MAYKLFWSEEAISNLEGILNYLEKKWSNSEISNFKTFLSKNLELITKFPLIFPESEIVSGLRRAVLNKQVSIFYKILDEAIYIAYLFDNRQDISRLR